MMHKIQTFLRMVRTYKNWVRLVLYRLNILPGPTIIKTREGSQFYIRGRAEQEADLYVTNESYLYGIHDEMMQYMKNAKVGMDIGAHIGTFSVFAGRHSSATIYAIEPEDDNRALLKKNLALNGLEGRVIPIEAIIASTSGEKELFIFKNRGLNSVFKDHGSTFGAPLESSKKVRGFSLRDFFEEKKIAFCDFMKVDIEGSEYDLFLNLSPEMYARIGVIGLEIGKDDKEMLVKHIESMGFRVTRPREEFSEYFCVNKEWEKKREKN